MKPETYAERVAKMTLEDIEFAELALSLAPEGFTEHERALLRERKLRLMKEAKR